MLAALGWKTLGAIAGVIILLGGLAVAIRELAKTAGGIKQWLRPVAPRVELVALGSSSSHERDEATGEITWDYARPAFTVRNNGPVPVYDVTAGIVNPTAKKDRVAHPQRVPVIKAETPFDFGSGEGFQIPSNWLTGASPGLEHEAVPYFVTLTDANDRRWDGVIDFREAVPRMRFKRI